MISKYLALFRQTAHRDRALFLKDFAAQTATVLKLRVPGLQRLTVNVLDLAQPQGGKMEEAPPYDVVAEIWLDDAGGSRRVLSAPGCVAVYRVGTSIEKDEPYDLDAPPRVKLFSFITPVAGLTDREFRRHWDEHVPIALRVHTACAQYVRHFVEASLPDDAPPVRGIGMIAMRTVHDLTLRMFNSPQGQADVVADTAEFVGNRLVFHATEHRATCA